MHTRPKPNDARKVLNAHDLRPMTNLEIANNANDVNPDALPSRPRPRNLVGFLGILHAQDQESIR